MEQCVLCGVNDCCRCRTFSFDSFSLWTKQAEAIDESPATLAEKLLKAQILTIEGGSESNSWAGCVFQLFQHALSTCHPTLAKCCATSLECPPHVQSPQARRLLVLASVTGVFREGVTHL